MSPKRLLLWNVLSFPPCFHVFVILSRICLHGYSIPLSALFAENAFLTFPYVVSVLCCTDNRAAGVRFGAEREPRFHVGGYGDKRRHNKVRFATVSVCFNLLQVTAVRRRAEAWMAHTTLKVGRWPT